MVASCALFAVGCDISDKDVELVSVAEVRELQQKAEKDPKILILVDPRSETAFAKEHLPGAVRMELRPDMEERGVDPRVASHKNIIVYGDDPASAAAKGMTKRLMRVGYDDVRMFAGGLQEWKLMQYPVESDAEPAKPTSEQ